MLKHMMFVIQNGTPHSSPADFFDVIQVARREIEIKNIVMPFHFKEVKCLSQQQQQQF